MGTHHLSLGDSKLGLVSKVGCSGWRSLTVERLAVDQVMQVRLLSLVFVAVVFNSSIPGFQPGGLGANPNGDFGDV